jgi:hypothetical protein
LRRWANNQVDHKVIVELCKFFNAQPGDLLEYIPNGTEVPQELPASPNLSGETVFAVPGNGPTATAPTNYSSSR